jgi:hypothetical protein
MSMSRANARRLTLLFATATIVIGVVVWIMTALWRQSTNLALLTVVQAVGLAFALPFIVTGKRIVDPHIPITFNRDVPTTIPRIGAASFLVFGAMIHAGAVYLSLQEDETTKVPLAPAAPDELASTRDLARAFALIRPVVGGTGEGLGHRVDQLARWAATRLRWGDLAVETNETTFALARKDSEAVRGKRMCVDGALIDLVKQTSSEAVFHGMLVTTDQHHAKLVAVRDTGDLASGSTARFCGVVIGTLDIITRTGGPGFATVLVGMFDLTANRADMVEQPARR